MALKGCLDRTALNFNCASADFFVECTATNSRENTPTIHSVDFCNYVYSPPPAASPSVPPGATTKEVVVINMKAEGDVADYTPAKKTAIAESFATLLGIDISLILIIVTAASVNIDVEIEPPADGSIALDVIEDKVVKAMPDTSTANAFLEDAGVTVISTPEVKKAVVIDTSVPIP